MGQSKKIGSYLPSEFTDYLKSLSTRKYKRGQSVLFQGEVPEYAFVIKSGIVRVYDISPEGDEKIVAYSSEFDIMPSAWVFGKSRSAQFYYEAFTPAELCLVQRSALLDLLHANVQVQAWYLERYVSMYVGATHHIGALEYSKAHDKILRLLQYLSTRFGEYIQPDVLRINLRLTQQDIANMAGLSRETTAIELGKLKRDGIVSCSKHQYFFKETALFHVTGIDESFLAGSGPGQAMQRSRLIVGLQSA